METTKRAGKYLVIGVVLTLFNYIVYTILSQLIFRTNELLWLATLIATSLAMILAYVLHSKITWKERSPGKLGVYKFFIWNIVTAVAISPALTQFFSLADWLYRAVFQVTEALNLPFSFDFIQSTGAFVLTTVMTMILNYLFYDKFVFGRVQKSYSGLPSVFNRGEKNLTPLISVVVPVYNVKKYVRKCISSLLSQSYQNLEIILVDDGSTDGSAKILDEFKKKDKRVKVIRQKNAGQSAARNTGILKARGEYVSFVDADDEANPEFIAELYAAMKNEQVAMAVCGIHYKRLKQGTAEDVYIEPLPGRGKEDLKTYVLHLLAVDGRMYSSVNKLYKADLAKKCRFDDGLNFAEDTKFVLDYLKRAKGEVAFVLRPLYIYNFGTEGSTIKETAVKWENWQKSYANLEKWAGKLDFKGRFWLLMVHLRWRVSYVRSKRRAKGV